MVNRVCEGFRILDLLLWDSVLELLHRDTRRERRYTEMFKTLVIRKFVSCPVHDLSHT